MNEYLRQAMESGFLPAIERPPPPMAQQQQQQQLTQIMAVASAAGRANAIVLMSPVATPTPIRSLYPNPK